MTATARHRRFAPSGRQIPIRAGDQRTVVVELGGGVRSYEVDGVALLDGYARDEMCADARGQLLIPWPNRLRDGRYQHDGEPLQVPLSEPEKGHAIHGFARWESWRIGQRSGSAVTLEHTLRPRAGYPFALRLSATYSLDGDGLTVRVTGSNIGHRPCPYAVGAHPYLRARAEVVDGCWLEAPGATRLLVDDRAIPIGTTPVAGTADDLRVPTAVGDRRLDTAYTDLRRDAAGRAWVRLWDPSRSSGVALWMDERISHYMLFTGDSLPDARRRRASLGVEPMSAAPNAFNSNDGLTILAPGEIMIASWGICPMRAMP